jgi:hypothetical protein
MKHNSKELRNSKWAENEEGKNLETKLGQNVLIEGNRRSQIHCQKAKDEINKKNWKERYDNEQGKRKM